MPINGVIRLFLLAATVIFTAAAPAPVAKRESESQIIARCDAGLADVIQFVRSKPELFVSNREGLFTIEEKREIWNTWKRFLEYELALETVARSHSKYYELDGTDEVNSFYLGYSASVTQY